MQRLSHKTQADSNPKVVNAPLKVYYIDHEPWASGYYRCALPGIALQEMEKAEVVFKEQLVHEKWPEEYCKQNVAKALTWCNILVMERQWDPQAIGLIDMFRKERSKVVIWEVDDYVSKVPDDYVIAKYWTPETVGSMHDIMRHVDALTLSTERLCKAYGEISGKPTYFLPNYIDASNPRWKVTIPKTPGIIKIGYLAGHTHGPDLLTIKDVIKGILRDYPNVVFKIVGFQPDWLGELPPAQLEADPNFYDILNYPVRMSDVDIGLAPLLDNEFNRVGKSNVKWLESSLHKIPMVLQNMPPYNSVVQSGVTGYLAKDPREWRQFLDKLIKDAKLRSRMGAAARDWTLKHHDIRDNVWRWEKAYTEILRNKEKAWDNEHK
jgi:glycosyltransferase involved in cell wall biosynthesis